MLLSGNGKRGAFAQAQTLDGQVVDARGFRMNRGDLDGMQLRNALAALHKTGFLKKSRAGWYEFVDPMFRSYVRMIAETEGIELSDESFAA